MESQFFQSVAAAAEGSRTGKRPSDKSVAGMVNCASSTRRGRRRPVSPPPTIFVPPGHATFRLLCDVSSVGSIIGKSGSIINHLRNETGAKIRIEDPVPDCDERVVLIVAPQNPKKMLRLSRDTPETSSSPSLLEGEEPREVCPAQEALIRVFERVLQMEKGVEEVTCKILAAKNQMGSVTGKGGKNIESIRNECRVKIRVLPPESLPAYAYPTDELIQISGDALCVKNAIIAISARPQDSPLSSKEQVVQREVGAVTPATLPDAHGEYFRNSVPTPAPGRYFGHIAKNRPGLAGSNRIPIKDQKQVLKELSFRLLCSNDKVGGVIGRGGTIVKALQKETGTSIQVGPIVAQSQERVITISASENPESNFSPAQNAVLRIFTRFVEVATEKGLDSGPGKGVPLTARLLISPSMVGCVMGKGGVIISEIRRVSGAFINIVAGDQVPKCAFEDDEVLQVFGEFDNVRDALFQITGRLRDFIFPSKMPNSSAPGFHSCGRPDITSHGRDDATSRNLYQSGTLSPNLDHQTTLAHRMDHLGLSNDTDQCLPPRIWASQPIDGGNHRPNMDIGSGSAAFRGGIELGSGSKTAIVTNTTVEILVPDHCIGLVHGENGANLSRIKQISGAKVLVHDPHPGTREGMVIISGTPEQTQAAQSLLHAFISSGQP